MRSAAPGLLERRAGGLRAVPADAPAARPQSIAVASDDDRARVGEHHVDAGEQVAVDDHGATDELVE
ncbi:unannotated protein [freshwater metagenome]|uniref:Unannotated protein n=1 Tax=freshwater metagenome TaxID=449393 RepID=A0A6J7RBY3_9ZZZZ